MAREYFVKITLRDELVEERRDFPFLSPKRSLDLVWLWKAISSARRRRSVRVLLLVIRKSQMGWGQIEEIHRELDRFHQSGKRSITFVEEPDDKSYYLACGAQQVFAPPSGALNLVGLQAELLFFKGLLDRLGVQPEFLHLGEYKSAYEIFTREQMSEASRRMSDSILTESSRPTDREGGQLAEGHS